MFCRIAAIKLYIYTYIYIYEGRDRRCIVLVFDHFVGLTFKGLKGQFRLINNTFKLLTVEQHSTVTPGMALHRNPINKQLSTFWLYALGKTSAGVTVFFPKHLRQPVFVKNLCDIVTLKFANDRDKMKVFYWQKSNITWKFGTKLTSNKNTIYNWYLM